jgi:uncharacterized protein YbgA (DUF1722 family)/uncharacterized protein YbbK (DUF523 family)
VNALWASHRPVRVGISACLLGEKVRFDGGHKRDRFLTEGLGPFVEWVPVCPEIELGLGAPRPSLRLCADGDDIRLVSPKTGEDHTDAMVRFARRRVAELADADLSGYVLKRASPTCGMEQVRVYGPADRPAAKGRGLFAAELMRHFPDLPVEEEGRLNDAALRENFVERIFAYRRLADAFRPGWPRKELVAFHSAHKLTLMAHSPSAYQELGQLVARVADVSPDEMEADYRHRFMQALTIVATPGRHANVLQHILGYMKKQLDSATRQDLLAAISDYADGLVPLVVPVTLLRHYVDRLDITYLQGQAYLDLHPKELMLRNHV